MKMNIPAVETMDVVGGPRIEAVIPELNKNDTLRSNLESCVKYGFRVESCEIRRVVVLTPGAYTAFRENLLADQTWLDDQGGVNSDYEDFPETVTSVHQLTEAQRKAWIAQSYLLAVAVVNLVDLDSQIIVDPQGYAYARYAGEPTIDSRKVVKELAQTLLGVHDADKSEDAA